MDIQYLYYFQDIARMESISKAAEKNHIAQPAMSRILSIIEKEYNARLFDRVGRNIILNDNGKILLDAVSQCLHTMSSVKEKIAFYNGQLSGSIKVCLFAPLKDFDEACNSFKQAYPLVDINTQNGPVGGRTELNTFYDLFIYMGPVMHNGHYNTCNLAKQEFTVIVHNDSPLARKKNVCFEDLANYEFVIPRFHAVRDIIHSYCNQAGFVPKIAGEVSLTFGQKLLVNTRPESRIAVLLKDIDGDWGEGFTSIPIAKDNAFIVIGMAWNADNQLKPCAEMFKKHLTDFYK